MRPARECDRRRSHHTTLSTAAAFRFVEYLEQRDLSQRDSAGGGEVGAGGGVGDVGKVRLEVAIGAHRLLVKRA
jgi:hypothetical protein